jgi:tRNA splicing ligase
MSEAAAMTNGEAPRLDRIEALLQRSVEQQLSTQQIVDSNAKAIEASNSVIASNSRAIEANSNAIAELRRLQSQLLAELRSSVSDVVGMLTTQAEEAAADRAELRRMIEAMYGNRGNGNGHEG